MNKKDLEQANEAAKAVAEAFTPFEKSARLEVFHVEWKMRLALLELGGYSQKVIADHRKDILHTYQLTEEDISKEGE